jgi:general secretion pathway protein F
MPIYAYKGVNNSGKSVNGTREAESPKAIKLILRREGVFLTEFNETGPVKKKSARKSFDSSLFAERVNSQDLAVATRQLATLVGAGIPLVSSLNALIEQIDNQTLKGILAAVKQRVNEGASLGDALGEHPKVFSGLYTNMVRAGESSGALDVVLNRLADFTENQAQLRSKLVGTMVYPMLMLVMAVGVTAMLFVFVIPKISKIFASQRMALPIPTQILIGTSNFLTAYWPFLLLLLGFGGWGFRRYIRSEKGKPHWDRFTLNAPLFGGLVRMIAITRFCKTLGTLLASGVPLLTAFDIVKNVLENTVLTDVVDTVRDCVKEGDTIAAPLKRSGEFPPIVTHMIDIGEKSGELEPMLMNVAASYDVQVEAKLRAMTSILEPIIIVVMGVVVACIVFAILMPMLQMSSAV